MKRIFFLTIITLLISHLHVNAQKCPRNFYDCKGACGWYIDRDGDAYCDYSAFSDAVWKKLTGKKDSIAQLALLKEQKRLDSIEEAKHPQKKDNDIKINPDKKVSGTNTEQNTSTHVPVHQCQHGVAGGCPNSSACEHAQKNENNISTPASAPVQTTNIYKPKKYDILLISIGALFLYLLTTFLANRKIMRKQTHRRIWNVVLLITFLTSGLLGLLLAVQINYHFGIDWYQTLLFLHVEFGIGMAIVSIFHVLWHVRYFVNIFRKSKSQQ
jgi:hypothetical protein